MKILFTTKKKCSILMSYTILTSSQMGYKVNAIRFKLVSLTVRAWINCEENVCLTFMHWLVRSQISVIFCAYFGSFLSTIHGRIDQVNQLLELDYQKRGGARYTALDKWTNQLNTLNQAIVSKLTWWHVKFRDMENGMF